MGDIISLFFLEVTLLLTVHNTVMCGEELEPNEFEKDDEPPGTWDNADYQTWAPEIKVDEEIGDDLTEDITWRMPPDEQDSILYDLYEKQPERIPEVDEDGVTLSDSWTILDFEDEEDELQESQNTFLNEEYNEDEDLQEASLESQSDDFYEEHDVTNPQADNLECDDPMIKKKAKRMKMSAKKRNNDEFYFKHKTYGKKGKKDKQKDSKAVKIPNWKQNCCIRGKRVGNGRRTFLSKNIFQECKDRARSLASRMSRSCKWIFWSCCEARALRRYYIYHQSSQAICR